MCQLRRERTLGCAAVGGEANRLRAGSLYGIVHSIYPENRQTSNSQWQRPITEDRGFYLSFAPGLSTENRISYVVHTMTLIPLYWSCPDLTMVSIFRENHPSRRCASVHSLLPLTVRATQPHLRQAESPDWKRICSIRKYTYSPKWPPSIYSKIHQATLWLTLSGKRLKVQIRVGPKETRSSDESPQTEREKGRSTNNKVDIIFELLIILQVFR